MLADTLYNDSALLENLLGVLVLGVAACFRRHEAFARASAEQADEDRMSELSLASSAQEFVFCFLIFFSSGLSLATTLRNLIEYLF
jgi:hypothetical protein